MRALRIIWKHEVKQAYKIARILVETKRTEFGWRTLLLPYFLLEYGRFRKNLYLTRKNILFTKRMARDATENILSGKEKGWEIRLIEVKTKKLLDEGRRGYYSEKIRRKQLHEIELLINHYCDLLNSGGSTYRQIIQKTYPSKETYLTFLKKLEKEEKEVIKASISSTRIGSKKERTMWFAKVEETVRNVRSEEVKMIFP